MSLGEKIRSGATWSLFGNTTSQVLGFLFGVVLARLLAPADFGMLVTISVFTGLAGFIAGGGMGQALVRAKEATKPDYDIVFTLQIIIGCLIYTGFFFASPLFAKWYDAPQYTDLLRVSALSFVFRPFNGVPVSILNREMRFRALSVVKIVALLISSAISIGMAYVGYGVWSLIVGGVAGSVTSAFLFAPLAKWRPGWSFDLRRGRELARYGLLVSITDIICYLRSRAGIFILSHTFNPSSVGLYNKGESLANMPHSFITGSVYQVLFRALAAEQDNLDRCRYLFFRSIELVAVYATPFFVGFLWLAEPLVRGVYGPNWVEASGPLFILSFAWPFWLMENLTGAVLAAKNWLDRETLVQASSFLLTCLAIFIGLSHGIDGVAWAVVGVSIYSALYMQWLVIRCLRARWSGYIRAIIPAVILNVILTIVLFVVDSIIPNSMRSNDLVYVALMGIAGGVIYTLCFLYLPIASLQTEQQRWKAKLRLSNTKIV